MGINGRQYNPKTGVVTVYNDGKVVSEVNIKDQAKDYASQYGISEQEALAVLQDAWSQAGTYTYDNQTLDGADQAAAAGAKFKERLRQGFEGARERSAQNSVLAQKQQVTNQLQRYFEMLNQPVMDAQGNYTDPLAKQLVASGTNVAQGEAVRRGIGGPMAGTAAMTSAQTALQPYLAQRVQLAGQALQVINQRDLSLEDQRLKADQLELERVGMENDRAASMWQAQQGQGQAIGAAIGTGIGALGFIGGPVLGAATMSGGAALGGAFGGMAAAGNGPTLSTPRFSNSSGRWASGKGGF